VTLRLRIPVIHGPFLLKAGFVACLLLLLGTESRCADKGEISRAEYAKNTEKIVELLEDKDFRVREAAAQALGRMRDPRAVDPLVNALGDPMDGVRDAAAVALKNLNEPLGERIYECLKGSKKAWGELARINDPRAIAPLLKALGARDGNVRANAAWTLRKLGDPRAVEPLINALGDRSPIVRGAAASAIRLQPDAPETVALRATVRARPGATPTRRTASPMSRPRAGHGWMRTFFATMATAARA